MNVSSALNRWLPFFCTRFAEPRRRHPYARRSKKRGLRFESLENRHLLSVTAFDDPTNLSDIHYQTNADATLAIAAQYGVLANDIGLQLAVTGHDPQSHLGAAVTVNTNGSVAYDPRNSATLKSLAAGQTVADTFAYSISGAVSDGLFAVSLFQVSPMAGANDHDLDTASETLAIWNALDLGVGAPPPGLLTVGSKTYFVNLYESDVEATVNYGSSGGTTGGGAGRWVPNLGYESIHGNGPGGSGGTLTGGEDFSVRAKTFITFDNAGTYTLAVGSDDGRRVAMSYPNGTPFHFQTAGGQLTGFTPGDSVMRYESTTGHLFSMGVFTVNAGDVIAMDAFFFERTAADSFEIAIKPGNDTVFGIGTDGFSLLADGVLGGTIHLSSTLAPLVPQVDSANVSIHVVGVNDTPTAFGSNLTIGEDDSVTAAFPATDPDSNSHLTYSITSPPPAAGILHPNDDGTFTFDTAGDFDYLPVGSTADVTFNFVATDEHGATSSPATITIHIVGANDTPVAIASNLTVGEDDAVTASFHATDVDSDSGPNTLTYSVTSPPPAAGVLHSNDDGTFTFDTAGAFDYLPVGATADVTFTFVATDHHGATSAPATVVIQVVGANDTPVAINSNLTVSEDSAVTGNFLASDPDADGGPNSRTYSITGDLPAAGRLTVSSDGTFTFDTAGDFNYLPVGSTAEVSFSFVATDQHGATSGPATVVIRVEGRNDAPVVVSPIGDVVVNQNAAPTSIDLAGRAGDPDHGDTLTYTAVSSNGNLVQTAVVNNKLILTYRTNANGLAQVTVTATDRWGASVAFSFGVLVRSPRDQVNIMVARLGELKTNGVLNGGEFNALEKKLLDGLTQIEKAQIKTGVNSVQAFINQINAFVRSGRLSSSDGKKLIDWSNDLIASVGG